MEFRDTLSRANSQVERVTDKLASLAPLATRLVIGLAFFQAGTGKLSLDALLRKILRSEPTPIGSLSPESP